jgi:Glycosyl hydrolases family 2
MNEKNRIKRVLISCPVATPAEAEIWISVYPQSLTSRTQVRGRLMGPCCRYASTVEVAYPMREQSREYEKEGIAHITTRVIVPEPNLWEPQTPFLYEGPLELWQSGNGVDSTHISYGLRMFGLGPKGLRWNSGLLSLATVEREQLAEAEALDLRQAGVNCLLLPVRDESADFWGVADHFGFLVLGRVHNREGCRQIVAPGHHPSALGCVLDSELLGDPLIRATLESPPHENEPLIGLELNRRPSVPLPRRVQFVVCKENVLEEISDLSLPRLVLKGVPLATRDTARPQASGPGILGFIYS